MLRVLMANAEERRPYLDSGYDLQPQARGSKNMRTLLTRTLQTLLGTLLVCGLSASARAQGLSTQQFCDGQQGAVAVLQPMLAQFSAYATPPAGTTKADVQQFMTMALRFGLGSSCSFMRINDVLNNMQSDIAVQQKQIADLQAQIAQMQSQLAK